jgi:hypothetical protein
MSSYALNKFHTTHLVLNVMAFAARQLDVDIHDNEIAGKLYSACCGLESHPEDCGFGSSDYWPYVDAAAHELGIVGVEPHAGAVAQARRAVL